MDRVTLRCIWLLLTAPGLFTPLAVDAFAVVVFPGSTHSADTAAMDAALGITGLAIEDFEDITLVPGLQVATTSPDSGPTATLPRLYIEGTGSFSNNSWAGPGALVNTSDNRIWYGPGAGSLDNIAARTIFHVPGVRTFGVGLGNFQGDLRDHALFVNGVLVEPLLESLPGFQSGINLRNGYLVITAGPGEVINSVAIEVRDNGGSAPLSGSVGDGLIFDHVAFGGVPEFGIARFTLSRSTVAGCRSVTGRITLSSAAPAGGMPVTVSDTLAAAAAPLSVIVKEGTVTRSFPIKTSAVATDESGTVSVILGAQELTRELKVRPIGMQSVALTPNPVTGGDPVQATARLECKAAPGDIVVELSSSNPAVAQTGTLTLVVPAGTQSVPFEVTTSPVATTTKPKIRASANGILKSRTLTVVAP